MWSCEIHERIVGKGRFVRKLKCVKSCEIHVKRREKVMRKLSCKKHENHKIFKRKSHENA